MHFFIDHTELSTLQSNDDGFGPATTDPSNVYNVTSRFQLANPAKAFACESGMMVVQQSVVTAPNPDDATKPIEFVNLIVKPDLNTNPLADVQYYVYRGVLKKSLIADTGLLQKTNADNELLTRIWAAVPAADSDSGTFGYDANTILDTELLESIFDNSRPDIKPVHVKEGEWIGTFGASVKIGFEIVLAGRFSADLKYARAEKHQIIATGLAGMDLRIKREEVLNFIDPAAFFGLHIDQQVKYSTYSPAKVVNKTSATVGNAAFIYTLLLTNFVTKNRVYLDIRSEKGYSYNFYQNYAETGTGPNAGHNIEIANQAVAGVTQVYATSGWPIFYTTASQATVSANNNLKIKLRIDDNTTPILFIKNSFFKATGKTSSYIKEGEISISGTATLTTWSKQIQFDFRNTGAGAPRPNIANYIKLNYFRQVHNAARPSVLLNEYYYDSAFCSIDLPRVGDATAKFKQVTSAEPIYVREPSNTDGTGNFGLNMANGAYWDTNRVLFYAIIQYENSARTSEKEYIHTYSQKLDLANDEYKAALLYSNTKILCRSYVTTGTGTLRIPGINHFENGDLGKKHKENAILLGLSVAEVTSIKADTQLDHLHHRFIHLQPLATNPQADTTAHRYFSYTVQIQGMLGNANPTRVTPLHAGNPIVVYSRDNQFFSSALFSAAETVTAGQNRIEFHVFKDGCVKITDNKDLGLVHGYERLYYAYFETSGTRHDVTDLEIKVSNKMGTGAAFSGAPTGYDHTIDYVPYSIDADTSYVYANGDVITEGLKYGNSNYRIKFKNTGKKAFLASLVEINYVALNIDFTYSATRRRYCRPEVVAAFIGALADVGAYTDAHTAAIPFNIRSTGSCFEDSTAFPSVEHNNGNSIDTLYQNATAGLTTAEKLARDQAYVNAMHRFGAGDIFRGTTPHYSASLTVAMDGGTLHNTHLHSGDVVLHDCERTL